MSDADGQPIDTPKIAPDGRFPGELFFSLLMLMGSLVLVHQAFSIAGFRSFSSAGVFPMIAAGTMVLSGTAIVLKTFRTSPAFEGSFLANFSKEVAGPKIIFISALIAAYLYALQPLGFVISSTLFLAIAICVLHRRHYLWMILLSIASVAVIYVLFRMVFIVVLPRGVFF